MCHVIYSIVRILFFNLMSSFTVKELEDMLQLLLLGAFSRSGNVGDRIVNAASSGDYQNVCRLLEEHPDKVTSCIKHPLVLKTAMCFLCFQTLFERQLSKTSWAGIGHFCSCGGGVATKPRTPRIILWGVFVCFCDVHTNRSAMRTCLAY